jgi:hypothetical protein
VAHRLVHRRVGRDAVQEADLKERDLEDFSQVWGESLEWDAADGGELAVEASLLAQDPEHDLAQEALVLFAQVRSPRREEPRRLPAALQDLAQDFDRPGPG